MTAIWSPLNGAPYYAGYLSACFGVPRLCNPWNAWVYPGPRMAWAFGHYDAIEDAKRGRVAPRLQAEFEER